MDRGTCLEEKQIDLGTVVEEWHFNLSAALAKQPVSRSGHEVNYSSGTGILLSSQL